MEQEETPSSTPAQPGHTRTAADAEKEKTRARNLKQRFGITIEDYDAMLAAQGGKCGICNKPPRPERRLAVDHDHSNGDIRGLLCTACNRELRYFDGHPDYLARAIDYLTKEPYHRGTAKNRVKKRRRRKKKTTATRKGPYVDRHGKATY